MKNISLPYGTGTVSCALPEEELRAVLTCGLHGYRAEKSEAELVEEALASPVGTLPLCELAKGKKNIVLIASDHTRPVPSKLLVPPMLRELRKGNPDANITILIASG